VYRLWLSNAIYSILPITYDNELFKGKNEFFPVTRFLSALTQHIRPWISKYPAIWALCLQNQGQVAGYAWGRPAHVMRLARVEYYRLCWYNFSDAVYRSHRR
jgi:hypothetical protein